MADVKIPKDLFYRMGFIAFNLCRDKHFNEFYEYYYDTTGKGIATLQEFADLFEVKVQASVDRQNYRKS